jgi:peroxiredoxin Q/BCP
MLRRFDARYFAASVDRPETNAKFAASLGIDYPVLSDPTKAVARAYGVLAPSGMASRWTFYIGRDGRILDIDKHVRASSHGADIAERLQEFSGRVQGS